MKLNKLPKTTKRSKKRVGRGYGSGKGGHTVGRGQKGQKSRSGGKVPLWFEGGQLPLIKRLPRKRGFKPIRPKKPAILNLSSLNKFEEKDIITPKKLLEMGFIDEIPKGGIKILGSGKLKKSLKFKGFKFSESAKRRIEKIGGKVYA